MAGSLNSSSLRATRLDTTIWAARFVLLCAGIISIVIFFKMVVIPFIFNLIISTLPNFWVSFKSWLSPPYIYIIVNFIIITIAASSNFHAIQKYLKSSIKETKTTNSNISKDAKNQTVTKNQNLQDVITWEDMIEQDSKAQVLEHCMNSSEETFLTDSNESTILEEEKLLHRAADEPELAVKEDERLEDNTLDATWEAIMEAQGKMARKQLKKSETWNRPTELVRAKKPSIEPEDDISDSVAWAKKEMRKSDTFNDSASLRRDKSMSQDELNKRVETFIKKMKLKRLESEHEQRLIENSSIFVY